MAITGELRNLDAALRDVLAHYQPGPEGLAELTGCVLALTYAEWAWWSFYQGFNTGTLAIGSTDSVVLYTVPDDERVWLDAIHVFRLSGDNNANLLTVTWPAAYLDGPGGGAMNAMDLTTPTTGMFWPDRGGIQGAAFVLPGPLLLEPGSAVGFVPDGSGSATSSFRAQLAMRRSKLVRALVP